MCTYDWRNRENFGDNGFVLPDSCISPPCQYGLPDEESPS